VDDRIAEAVAPAHRALEALNSTLRWATLVSLGVALICCLWLAFPALLLGVSGVRGGGFLGTLVISLLPWIAICLLGVAALWLERHQRAYTYLGPLIILALMTALHPVVSSLAAAS
jgi:hypothetical protein